MDGVPVACVTIGETMLSLRTDRLEVGGSCGVHIAGAESNVAIGLARAGHAVAWCGVLSCDDIGDLIAATLYGEGVQVVARRDPDRLPGVMVLQAPSDHARRVTYVRKNSAGSALTSEDVETVLGLGARRLHLTGITPALSASARQAWLELAQRAVSLGVAVSVDVNYRPALWSRAEARDCLRALPVVATYVASEDELDLLADEGAREGDVVAGLLAAGASEVVVKRGERGASAFRTDEAVHLPAAEVPVVDVIGAGDALCAGVLSGLLDGASLAESLARGVAAAGSCVSVAGDWEGLPKRCEFSQTL